MLLKEYVDRKKAQNRATSKEPVSWTLEDDRTVLYKTKSLYGTKPNTNPKTKLKTNPNLKLALILTLFSCFVLFSSTVP